MNKITHPITQGRSPLSHPQHSFAPTPEDGAALRRAFGRFGTGVTVVTTLTNHGPLGMTANSFSSISLDPALVMWAPGRASARHDAFAGAAHFCVHILADTQQDIALHFASQGHDFDGFDWGPATNGAPAFSGCLATFECSTFAVHPAGDHSIILGRVTHVTEREGAGTGLLFDQGRFGTFTAT